MTDRDPAEGAEPGRLSSRERVALAIRGQGDGRPVWGELVLDDGLIADYLKTENVDHARRREFVERLGLDLVCLNLSRGYDEWPGLAAWAKDGDRFIFAVLDGGFQRGIVDMGFEPFLLAVARKNTDLHDYFRKANQQSLELARRALGEGADGILVADDIAYNHGLLAPPSFFHAFYLPALQGFINDLEPGKATVFFHSDGDLHELLPELANCGLNGLQGLESAAGMDLTRARKLVGNRFCLWGNYDPAWLTGGLSRELVMQGVEPILRATGDDPLIFGTSSGLYQGMTPQALDWLAQALRRISH